MLLSVSALCLLQYWKQDACADGDVTSLFAWQTATSEGWCEEFGESTQEREEPPPRFCMRAPLADSLRHLLLKRQAKTMGLTTSCFTGRDAAAAAKWQRGQRVYAVCVRSACPASRVARQWSEALSGAELRSRSVLPHPHRTPDDVNHSLWTLPGPEHVSLEGNKPFTGHRYS